MENENSQFWWDIFCSRWKGFYIINSLVGNLKKITRIVPTYKIGWSWLFFVSFFAGFCFFSPLRVYFLFWIWWVKLNYFYWLEDCCAKLFNKFSKKYNSVICEGCRDGAEEADVWISFLFVWFKSSNFK